MPQRRARISILIVYNLLLLLSSSINLKCRSETGKGPDLNQLVENWTVLTEKAVQSCSDSLAVRQAWRMINWVSKNQLRERVLRKLKDTVVLRDALFVVEERTGDSQTYSVSIRIGLEQSIYLFEFSEKNNEITCRILDESSEDYRYYSSYLEPWDDFKDFVTQDQKIFLCGNNSLREETIFRVKL
jgi:hypothetical protein